ncbi:unnamed protein product, partial [Didymodactylos carnosus]
STAKANSGAKALPNNIVQNAKKRSKSASSEDSLISIPKKKIDNSGTRTKEHPSKISAAATIIKSKKLDLPIDPSITFDQDKGTANELEQQ